MIEKFVRATPKDKLVDFKLLWRDPLPRWISQKGRMLIVGDAAHPTHPSSGQGGAQAIEDAATITIALELAGKQDVPTALRAVQSIRFARCLKQ